MVFRSALTEAAGDRRKDRDNVARADLGLELGEVLSALVAEHPGLQGQVLTEDGSLHRFVNVYLNDDDVRYLDKLETKVGSSDIVAILPAVAGGLG